MSVDCRLPLLRAGVFAALSITLVPAACSSTVPDLHASPDYQQQFAVARADYFAGVDGNSSAIARAQDAFASLEREHPADPTLLAYIGSLELLEAARTWAVWNKHKLATDGLSRLDRSVALAPDNLEVRFIHGETTWHLPFFYHRKEEAVRDFAYVAPRAESAVQQGSLPAPLAAAALDSYGRILEERSDAHAAREAFEAAVRVAGDSPAGRDASRRLE